MKKVFLDSSVLIAATGSKSGASALILSYCRKEIIEGYICKYVFIESKRNVRNKFNEQQKQRFNALILKSNLTVIEDQEDQYALVLAAAHMLHVDYLITHNTKDFMTSRVQKKVYPIQILTPKKYIHMFKKQIGR